ncbi:hypothetical protein DRQ05_05010 [bacterium]|nr:MAG: hypothetical protein DRQ05_05010 [bacterium]
MKRNSIFCLISLIALSAPAKKVNIILLLTDDQPYRLGMGIQGLEPPDIDALAKRGFFYQGLFRFGLLRTGVAGIFLEVEPLGGKSFIKCVLRLRHGCAKQSWHT